MPSKIALLATGDEITNGDILNTNSQVMAQLLMEHGLSVGLHMVTPDVDQDIVNAIHYLLEEHHAIIITGGLGPTSDDRTRFALAQAVEQSLVFDEAWWQAVVERMTSLKLTIPESNKQQALFPEKANIILNPRGTAAGCYVEHQDKYIFMLPGPPFECIPMFNEVVLPALLDSLDKSTIIQRRWRLFGVSEGHIATELDEALAHYNISTGYRIDYPYIEFKVFADEQQANDNLWDAIHQLVEPHILSHEHTPASRLLVDTLTETQGVVAIEDHATGGRLAAKILKPRTHHALSFGDLSNAEQPDLAVKIEGLEELWQGETLPGKSPLTLTFLSQGQEETITRQLPFRHEKVLKYAIELICHEILQRLK